MTTDSEQNLKRYRTSGVPSRLFNSPEEAAASFALSLARKRYKIKFKNPAPVLQEHKGNVYWYTVKAESERETNKKHALVTMRIVEKDK